MNHNNSYIDIKPVLDLLRYRVGDSEYGYRIQALFAHVLHELGETIVEVNQQGHPDIKAVHNGYTGLFQIKSIAHSHAGWTLIMNPNDIKGICPNGPNEIGYYAVLDCAAPVSWIVSKYDNILRHQSLSINIESFIATSDKNFSDECTSVFTEIITQHKKSLHLLTYRILRDRVLRGENI